MNIIDNESVSYEQVLQDIKDYLDSSSGVDASKWLDRYSTGAGMTIVELISGLASYLSFHSLNTRKEAFIETARLKTSIYALAAMRGYPVNRPSAPYVYLKLSGTGAVEGNIQPIAKAFGYDIVIGENAFNEYGEGVYKCYFGKWETMDDIEVVSPRDFYSIEITPSESEDNTVWYIDNNSSNIKVRIKSGSGYESLKVTKNSEDLIREVPGEDRDEEGNLVYVPLADVLERTTAEGVALIFGSSSPIDSNSRLIGRPVVVNDKISLQVLMTQGGISNTTIAIGDIASVEGSNVIIESLVPYYKSLNTNTPNFYSGSGEESLSKIKYVVPGYYSSYRRMVTADDHKYITMGQSSEIQSANCRKSPGSGEDSRCCTVEIGYLRGKIDEETGVIEDSSEDPDSDVFESELREKLEDFKPVGENIVFGRAYGVKAKFKIVVYVGESFDEEYLKASIQQIIFDEIYKIKSPLRRGKITTEVSKLPGVVRVYFVMPTEDFYTQFKEYLYTTVDDIEIVFKSLSTEVEYEESSELGYVDPAPRFETGKVVVVFKAGEAIPEVSGSEIDPYRDIPVKYNPESVLDYNGEPYVPSVEGITCSIRTVGLNKYLTFSGTPSERTYIEDYVKFKKSGSLIESDYQTIAYRII